ncbi:MAG: hypothetical protein RLZZ265_3872 [Verrucomicrobiota bacterium]|jgi:hypothetical protein
MCLTPKKPKPVERLGDETLTMTDYKPSSRTLIVLLASLFAVVLPAICFAAMGYIWVMKNGLNLDTDAKPETIGDRMLILAQVLPMIPLMVMAVFISGVPWMFVMSRLLSWADIVYFTKQKGPRLPIISACLDRLWLRMIESRRPRVPLDGESQ